MLEQAENPKGDYGAKCSNSILGLWEKCKNIKTRERE
jgi:hypothetical protein